MMDADGNNEDKNENSASSVINLPPMPLLSITSPQTIEFCSNLSLRDTDIFICSYPKSGTTWMQHIILSLLLFAQEPSCSSQGLSSEEPPAYTHVSEYAPFFEIDAHWNAADGVLQDSIQERHRQLGRRVFNTHLRWDLMPKPNNQKQTIKERMATGPKFIYLIRSPMDVCWSFYHHLSHQKEGTYEDDFGTFFDDWIDGKIPFGSWVDHILSYLPAIPRKHTNETNSIDDQNAPSDIIVIFYEDMVSNLEDVVSRLVDFLDLQDAAILSSKDRLRKEILPLFSFDNMKKELDRFQPKSVGWKGNFCFLRKGVVGDAKVTKKQWERFTNVAVQRKNLLQHMKKNALDPKIHETLQNMVQESPPLISHSAVSTPDTRHTNG